MITTFPGTTITHEVRHAAKSVAMDERRRNIESGRWARTWTFIDAPIIEGVSSDLRCSPAEMECCIAMLRRSWRYELTIILFCLPILIFLLPNSVFADTTFNGNEPEEIVHGIGMPVGISGWGAAPSWGAGLLIYGPYTSEFENGVFKAVFNLSVDDNSSDDLIVAFIDVYDNASNREIARREVHRKEFVHPQTTQSFDLTFVTQGANNLEFRVYVFGCSYVVHQATTLTKISSLEHQVTIDPRAIANAHSIGSLGREGHWSASPLQGQGYLAVIPYEESLVPSNYSAISSSHRRQCAQ